MNEQQKIKENAFQQLLHKLAKDKKEPIKFTPGIVLTRKLRPVN